MNDKDLAALKALAQRIYEAKGEPIAVSTVATAEINVAIARIEQQAARIAELEAAPARDVGGLTDERVYELVAEHELCTRKPFGQVVFDSVTVLKFARAIESETRKGDTKPVAYMVTSEGEPELGFWFSEEPGGAGQHSTPLYASPNQPVVREVLATKEAEQDTKGIKEQAEGWLAVCATLDELRFGWRFRGCNGMAGAINTIRSLATSPAPSASQGGVKEGWQLVPKQMTVAMALALHGREGIEQGPGITCVSDETARLYDAMLSAAPSVTDGGEHAD